METNLTLLIDNYLDYCRTRKNLDTKTLKAYRIDLIQFRDTLCEDRSPFEKAFLNMYIASLHVRYKPKTVKRKIAAIKAFFRYLEFEDILLFDPFKKIDIRFREPQCLPRTIPLNSIQTLFKTLYRQYSVEQSDYQKKVALRNIAVLELLFATGVRISELCSLHPQQLDFHNASILIYGKGSKERLVQIGSPEVMSILEEYGRAFQDEILRADWFFINRLGHRLSEQSVRNMINKYAKMAGIDIHITPHMFRHSFATLLLEADVDIRYIQKMLGHSSITTTQIYTEVTLEKQKAILAEKHPRNSLAVR